MPNPGVAKASFVNSEAATGPKAQNAYSFKSVSTSSVRIITEKLYQVKKQWEQNQLMMKIRKLSDKSNFSDFEEEVSGDESSGDGSGKKSEDEESVDEVSGDEGGDKVSRDGGRDKVSGDGSGDKVSEDESVDEVSGDGGGDKVSEDEESVDEVSGDGGGDKVSEDESVDEVSGDGGGDKVSEDEEESEDGSGEKSREESEDESGEKSKDESEEETKSEGGKGTENGDENPEADGKEQRNDFVVDTEAPNEHHDVNNIDLAVDHSSDSEDSSEYVVIESPVGLESTSNPSTAKSTQPIKHSSPHSPAVYDTDSALKPIHKGLDSLQEASQPGDIDEESSEILASLKRKNLLNESIEPPQVFLEFLHDSEFIEIEDLTSSNVAAAVVVTSPVSSIESDSDSDSWEVVTTENDIDSTVKEIVTQRSSIQRLISQLSIDREQFIGSLSKIISNLTKKVFFPRPDEGQHLHTEGSSPEIAVSGSSMISWEDYYRILILEDAHAIIDMETVKFPSEEDLQGSFKIINENDPVIFRLINVDLERIPSQYVKWYAQFMKPQKTGDVTTQETPMVEASIEDQEATLRPEFIDKVRLVLFYSLTAVDFDSFDFESVGFESVVFGSNDFKITEEEDISIVDFENALDLPVENWFISYLQGFDQIAAYFSARFDVSMAALFTYRFMRRFMRELTMESVQNSLRNMYFKIDNRAIELLEIHSSKTTTTTTITQLDRRALFKILRLYPFSDKFASVFYFTSAASFTDLEAMLQTVLKEVPQSQSDKAISLLAAASMLQALQAFDKVFEEEFGLQLWNSMKFTLAHRPDDTSSQPSTITAAADVSSETHQIISSLLARCMGELFLTFGMLTKRSGPAMSEFLEIVRTLIPHLPETL